jgi:hypothetical protein
VNVHRELVRNLQAWHSMYEADDVGEVLVASDGRSYCLWDIDWFYEGRHALPDQMRRAIELCLYANIFEREAAVQMGVAPTNPVAIYATIGLTQLLRKAYDGLLPGYLLVRGDDAA